jgi:hypothetical protein
MHGGNLSEEEEEMLHSSNDEHVKHEKTQRDHYRNICEISKIGKKKV